MIDQLGHPKIVRSPARIEFWRDFLLSLVWAVFPVWSFVQGPLWAGDTSNKQMMYVGVILAACTAMLGLYNIASDRRKSGVIVGVVVGAVFVAAAAYLR
jgi:hypothetical protein